MGDSANKENKPSFFTGVKTEFAKIVWPGRDDLTKQSIAVVSVTVVVAILISVIDKVVQLGVNLLAL